MKISPERALGVGTVAYWEKKYPRDGGSYMRPFGDAILEAGAKAGQPLSLTSLGTNHEMIAVAQRLSADSRNPLTASERNELRVLIDRVA